MSKMCELQQQQQIDHGSSSEEEDTNGMHRWSCELGAMLSCYVGRQTALDVSQSCHYAQFLAPVERMFAEHFFLLLVQRRSCKCS